MALTQEHRNRVFYLKSQEQVEFRAEFQVSQVWDRAAG